MDSSRLIWRNSAIDWFDCVSLSHQWTAGRDVSRQNTSPMHVLKAVFLMFLQSTLSALVVASESPPTALGKACSTNSNRLDPRTRRFTSDCDAQTFCSGSINGTCIPRQCRREEFPSGYTNQTVPVLCPAGSFCPDEGDACHPLVPVGQPCQFNRDDQCAPSNTFELADYHNFDGSVCLHSICAYVCSLSSVIICITWMFLFKAMPMRPRSSLVYTSLARILR